MTQPHFAPVINDDYVKAYEHYLVPAIYAQWAFRVAEIAKIDLGDQVLDVECRTGVLARSALLETGLKGKVTGLDTSDKMLKAARKQSTGIDWQLGDVMALPFDNNQFDRVLCQFSLMFIENRVKAIKEMLRVCRPNGLVVLATWAPLEHGGAYDRLIEIVNKHVGNMAAQRMSSRWSLGEPGAMDALLLSSGVNEYECHERVGQSRYPSKESFVESHLRLVGEFDDMERETYQKILSDADTELRPFLTNGGQLVAHLDANIFVVKDE